MIGPSFRFQSSDTAVISSYMPWVVHIAPRFGSVALETDPVGAAVFNDGRFLGRTPLALNEMPLGSWTLRLSMTTMSPSVRLF